MAAKVKTWAEEIEERVRLEGIEQGLEQGLREGELKSLRESIMDFVVERFPEASAEEVIGKLHAIDSLDQLKFIMKRALKWKNYEDVWTLPGDSDH